MDDGCFTPGFTRKSGRAADGNLFGVIGSLQSQVAHSGSTVGQVGQEELERSHAERHDGLDVAQRGFGSGGQRGVKSEVNGRIALRLREPLPNSLERRAAAGLDGEVDVGGYATTRRRA